MGVAVLAFDVAMSDDAVRAVATEATVAGRRAVVDGTAEAMQGAIESAQHSASRRGEEAVVLDRARGLVGFRRGDAPLRVRRLVVVRYLDA